MRELLFVCIFLLFIPITHATTYTCCKNFEANNGTILSNFESDGWVADSSFPLTTLGNNSRRVNGTGSTWVLGEPTTGTGSITKTLSTQITFDQIRNGGFWAYVDNTSTVSNITVIFIGTASNYSRKVYPVVFGWNRLTFNTSNVAPTDDFIYSGSFSRNTNITSIKLRAQRVVGAIASTNVTYDEFKKDMKGRPKVIITFDDATITTYTNAYPILKGNNQKAVVFVPINYIGNGSRWMNLSNIKDLYNNGWDISGHGYNHENFSTLSTEQLDTVLNQSYDNLTAWGFTRSNKFTAYPFGAYNQSTINETKKVFYFASGITDYTQPQIQGDLNTELENYFGNYQIYRHWPDDPSISTTLAKINRTIAINGTLILAFHNVTTVDNLGDSISTSNFTIISNYLASRSADIDVITFSDYLNEIPDIPTTKQSTSNQNTNNFISAAITLLIFILIISPVLSRTPKEYKNILALIIAVIGITFLVIYMFI